MVSAAHEDDGALVVRTASAHGLGVFATRDLAVGVYALEYTGERISHAEGAARYDDQRGQHTHTLLFTVDATTVIDGGAGGGMGRYVNHSCAPNCEAVLDDGRIFFETLRPIRAGEELTYDYRLRRPRPLPRDWRRRYACRCAAPRCRTTMLVRPPGGVARARAGRRRGAIT
ncbi:MAG TPA: SET domain-containing protein [Candidatus Binatia bacterium]|jgi:hypothetical protein